MANFSARSRANLDSCDDRLQRVFDRVIQITDCTIIEGHRNEERQNEMLRTGKSQLGWPDGNHNKDPSLAADVAAYPIDWKDRERATLFAGLVVGVASELARSDAAAAGVANATWRLRWGGDWDSDWQVKDNNFDDLVHFEIVDL